MIELVDSVDAGTDRAARLIADVVRAAPGAAIGFATGATPLGLYRRLAAERRRGAVDFGRLRAVALDEYAGLGPEHPDSFAAYLNRHVTGPLGIPEDRVDLLRGDAPDPDAECDRYERMLAETPVAVQVLGIGRNGHLAFNEPGAPLDAPTRVVELSPSTRRVNARALTRLDETPRRALTQGVATILRAERLVLLAFGDAKAEALAAALEGPITPGCPASALQRHPDVLVLADPDAAGLLTSTVSAPS